MQRFNLYLDTNKTIMRNKGNQNTGWISDIKELYC